MDREYEVYYWETVQSDSIRPNGYRTYFPAGEKKLVKSIIAKSHSCAKAEAMKNRPSGMICVQVTVKRKWS